MKLSALLFILAPILLLPACERGNRISGAAEKTAGDEAAHVATLDAGTPEVAEFEALKIVATIRPLSLLAHELLTGVEDVDVHTLLPGSADPHNFALRVSDRKALAEADLVLWVGPALERFLVKPMASRSAGEQVIMLSMPQLTWPGQAGETQSHDHRDESGAGDPHVWLGPDNARIMAAGVAAKLKELRPQQAVVIQTNLEDFEAALNAFVAETGTRFQAVKKEPFAVHHNALGHFVQSFGLHQVAAVNNSSEERLSASQLELLRQNVAQARCLLVETGSPAQRLAQTLKLPVVEVDPLAISPQITSYLQMLESLRNALARCISAE